MMRIIFLCSTLGLFFLTSCLENVGNSQTFPTDNAVVSFSYDYPGMTFLDTPWGRVVAPELSGKGDAGDCLLASFTVDYDNQPKFKYYSASDIKYTKIAKTDIVMLDAGSQNISDTIDELSVDSIKNLGFVGTVNCIDNNLFMGFDNTNYDYQLVYSDSLIDEIPVLYVCAKSIESSATTYGDYKYQAFDITPFLERYADKDNNFSFYLKYKKGIDANGKNVYETLSQKALTLGNYQFTDY
ncbi:MAG: hypothetical protein FWD60_02355 [Candidatus Azobacteroides sp.]|nr:hypothetical protein [Candidatus Azobacteroides sp.]